MDEALQRYRAKVNDGLPLCYMYFKRLPCGHRFKYVNGIDREFLKLRDNLNNHLPLHYQDPNCIYLRNNHFVVVSSQTVIEDLGLAENGDELFASKLGSLTDAEKLEYNI